MESTGTINIIVWTESTNGSEMIASTITGGNVSNGVASGEHEGTQLRVYTRTAGEPALAHPQGVADALIVSISKESLFFEQAKEYVNTRRGIPCKFICSSEDLTEVAQSVDATYLSDVSEAKGKIISTVRELDATLRTAFNAIDINGNGFLTADELVAASGKLGHAINSEEAKLIVKALSTDDNITFSAFKTWWIRGRGDFNSFRRFVKVEMQVGHLIKKGSEVFNTFVQNLQKEECQSGYKGKVNIGPVNDFETGFGLDTDIALGNEYDEVVNSLPDYFKTSPISFSVEIPVSSEEAGHIVKETLQGLKDMLEGVVPQLAQAKQAGVNVNFRSVGNSVFVDISTGGMIADQLLSQLSQYNFAGLNFSGTAFFNIFTGLRLSDILSGNVDNIISRVTLFKIESHSQVLGVKNLIYALTNLYQNMGQNVVIPRSLKNLIPFMKLLAAMKNFDFEFKYDAEEVANTLKDAVGEFGGQAAETPEGTIEALNGTLGQYQAMGPMMIEGFRPIIDSVVEPFKPAIQALNLDRLGLVYSLPSMRMHYKLSVHLPGLTKFVNETVLGNSN